MLVGKHDVVCPFDRGYYRQIFSGVFGGKQVTLALDSSHSFTCNVGKTQMKKAISLISVAMLSTSLLLTGCAPDNNNQQGAPNNQNGGSTAGTQGVQNQGGGRAGALTNDQPRMGIQGQNMRNDRNLEARVEAIPGVRAATVLVSGNSAFVMVDSTDTPAGTQGGTSGGTMGHNIDTTGGPTATGRSGATTNRSWGMTNGTASGNYNASSTGHTLSDTRGGTTYGTRGITGTTNGYNYGGTAYGTRGTTGAVNGTTYGTRGADANNNTIYAADSISTDLKGSISNAITRANPAIRNVYFITKFK